MLSAGRHTCLTLLQRTPTSTLHLLGANDCRIAHRIEAASAVYIDHITAATRPSVHTVRKISSMARGRKHNSTVVGAALPLLAPQSFAQVSIVTLRCASMKLCLQYLSVPYSNPFMPCEMTCAGVHVATLAKHGWLSLQGRLERRVPNTKNADFLQKVGGPWIANVNCTSAGSTEMFH